VKGYVVVFEGDDESGYSAYSPDLPGVIAAGESRQETVGSGSLTLISKERSVRSTRTGCCRWSRSACRTGGCSGCCGCGCGRVCWQRG
jgi:hypothetical protein